MTCMSWSVSQDSMQILCTTNSPSRIRMYGQPHGLANMSGPLATTACTNMPATKQIIRFKVFWVALEYSNKTFETALSLNNKN
ncbi:MAG: hypothetical protein Ct9H300mP25_07960 [Acidobacteriota bacterium]|nr:MAG: hypothetical protein Ct9H300mP25_07960 [Acidobacteriota bacterium]